MSIFEKREGAMEKGFVLDAEQEFKAEARRNKLLAEWAAPLAGKDDVAAYITAVIASDFQEAGDDDVFRKVKADLDAAGAGITGDVLRAKMDELKEIARDQIANG